MSYNSSAYQKAINILERRREKAALEANARKAEILSRLPEIDEIQFQNAFLIRIIMKLKLKSLRLRVLLCREKEKKFLKRTAIAATLYQNSIFVRFVRTRDISTIVCAPVIRRY